MISDLAKEMARFNITAEIGSHITSIQLDRFKAIMAGEGATPDERVQLRAIFRASTQMAAARARTKQTLRPDRKDGVAVPHGSGDRGRVDGGSIL